MCFCLFIFVSLLKSYLLSFGIWGYYKIYNAYVTESVILITQTDTHTHTHDLAHPTHTLRTPGASARARVCAFVRVCVCVLSRGCCLSSKLAIPDDNQLSHHLSSMMRHCRMYWWSHLSANNRLPRDRCSYFMSRSSSVIDTACVGRLTSCRSSAGLHQCVLHCL